MDVRGKFTMVKLRILRDHSLPSLVGHKKLGTTASYLQIVRIYYRNDAAMRQFVLEVKNLPGNCALLAGGAAPRRC